MKRRRAVNGPREETRLVDQKCERNGDSRHVKIGLVEREGYLTTELKADM